MPDAKRFIGDDSPHSIRDVTEGVTIAICLLCDEEVGASRRAKIHFEGDHPEMDLFVHEKCAREYSKFMRAYKIVR